MDEKSANEFLKAVVDSGGRPVLKSRARLDDGSKALISDAVKSRLGYAGGLVFEEDPDAPCGVELKVNGYKMAWTIEEYLEGMEAELSKVWGEGN